MAFRAMLLSFNGYKLIFCAFKLSPTSFSCVWPTKARPHFETSLLSRSNLPKPIPAPSQRACFCIFLFSSSGGVFGRLPNSFFFFLGRFQLPNFSDQKKKKLPNLKNHILSCFSGTPPSTTETVNQKYECDSSVQIFKDQYGRPPHFCKWVFH